MSASIGVTGTRQGATKQQLRVLMGTLLQYYRYRTDPIEFHHGACIGVDLQAALIGSALRFHITAHPPDSYKYLSRLSLSISQTVLPELSYLERDRVIVDKSDLLIALPNTSTPVSRSGTWYTYNYALAQSKTTMLILPDGVVK